MGLPGMIMPIGFSCAELTGKESISGSKGLYLVK